MSRLRSLACAGSGLVELRPPGTGTQVDYPSLYPDGVHIAVVDYGSTPGSPAGVLRRIDTQANTAEQLTDVATPTIGSAAWRLCVRPEALAEVSDEDR